MRRKGLVVVAATGAATLALVSSVAATPPASPNASCVGQSVSTFIPTKLVHPYGPIVADAVQTVEPNAGQAVVKPEATAPHDGCV